MNKLCRTCLRMPQTLLPLFEQETLCAKIKTISNIEVSSSANLPETICQECVQNIDFAFNLRTVIINSDRDLKERLPHLAKEGESEDSDSQEGISVDCDLLTEEHTEAKDNDSNMYKCDLCNKVYVFRRSLTTHRKIHFESERKFQCRECSKRFFSANLLRRHMRVHAGERGYPCNICGKKLASQFTLGVHMRRHTQAPATDAKISRQYRNKETKYLIRKGEVRQCKLCNFKFTDYDEWEKHRNNHRCICDVCGKSVRSDVIQVHLRTHTYDPVPCLKCGHILKNRGALNQHMNVVHRGILHKCDLCEKSFKLQHALYYHRKTHFESERKFKCLVCNKGFFMRRGLRNHMQVHTGERPFPCNICGKRLTSKHVLKDHMRVHTKERPFKCERCPKSFSFKCSLTSHLKSKHSRITDTEQQNPVDEANE